MQNVLFNGKSVYFVCKEKNMNRQGRALVVSRMTIAFMLCTLFASGNPSAIVISAQTDDEIAVTYPGELLANGQFVYGPNVGDFDLEKYLVEANSPLSEKAEFLEDKAWFYSINPRVLLTLLEMRCGAVSQPQTEIEQAIGYEDISSFDKEFELLAETLVEYFYADLYETPDLPTTSSGEWIIDLAEGQTVVFAPSASSATLAILAALGPLSNSDEWQALISPIALDGFTQTYRRLFPESNPLDNSNVIVPNATPPANLLKLPFTAGDRWTFSGGPHEWDGCDGGDPYSAVDFAPGGYPCDSIPTNRWVTAAAAGTITHIGANGAEVYMTFDSPNDAWGARYLHIANTAVGGNQHVAQDTRIGNPSCRACTGCTGCHGHFDLRYNGAWVTIVGTAFEGWVVHSTGCYSGYLEKGGQRVWKGGRITSIQPDTSAPTTSRSLSGTSGDHGWYRSAVQVTLTASDNSGGSGVDHIEYKIDDGSWQTYADPFTISGEGRYAVYYKAQDKAGNWESQKQVSVSIDATAPTGFVALNAGASSTPGVLVHIESLATDATSGLYQLRVRNAGETWGAWQAYTGRLRWQLPAVTGQSHTVEVQIKDVAGNVSTTYADAILLDIYPERPASTGYRLARSTWGAAPKNGQSTNYRLRGTAGQPSLIGDLRSDHYRLLSGYWSGQGRAGAPRRVYLPMVVRR
jgi:murein DD-endopeptidase MepM/ murein hydrolase activator NlpD